MRNIKSLILLCVVMLPLQVSATLIGDTIIGDVRGIDADGSALISETDVEFIHSDFGFDNDAFTADFSDDLFTLKLEVFGPFGNIASSAGILWSFSDFDWLGFPDSEIVDVQLVDFMGVSFSDPTDISFTGDSISIRTGEFSLSYDDPDRRFTSGTFQIVASHQVSEPSLLALMMLSMLGIFYRRCRV